MEGDAGWEVRGNRGSEAEGAKRPSTEVFRYFVRAVGISVLAFLRSLLVLLKTLFINNFNSLQAWTG